MANLNALSVVEKLVLKIGAIVLDGIAVYKVISHEVGKP